MKKIYYIEEIPDKLMDVKYAQYQLLPYASDVDVQFETNTLKSGYILEDIEGLLNESIVNYQNQLKFVRSETVLAALCQKLCEKIKLVQSEINNLQERVQNLENQINK